MFVRIVKLSFHEENIPLFLENFESIKERIRCAPETCLLELYHKENKSIFFTYSYWDEEDLENYRNSEFFNEV
jgi:heme-degrading monooxygenase HmoA